ncbi:hypothetical protein [Actinacidiphila glaucinigra]
MAEEIVRALESGRDEAILDDFSRVAKASLSGDITELHKIRPENFPG